jgi:hypothetical protein
MAITIGIIALVVICIALASRGRTRRDGGSGISGFSWFDGGSSSDCGGGSDGGGGGGDGGGC